MGRKGLLAPLVLASSLAMHPTGAAQPQEKTQTETRNTQDDVRRAVEILLKKAGDISFETDGIKYSASAKKEKRGDENVIVLTISKTTKDEDSKYTGEGLGAGVSSANMKTKKGEFVVGRNSVFQMDGDKAILLSGEQAHGIITAATEGYRAGIVALLENADKGEPEGKKK